MNSGEIDLPDHTRSAIINLAQQYPAIEEIILFGSRVSGNAKHGSDIDIALAGKGVDGKILTAFHTYLEEETDIPYFFDVVHLDTIVNDDLKRHIVEFGKIIYSRDGSNCR